MTLAMRALSASGPLSAGAGSKPATHGVPDVRAVKRPARRPRTGILSVHPGSPQVMAITSGKGGVGKSNIAAGLSILLAEAGRRVALVDADIGMGNLDVLMGIGARANMADVLAGRRRLRDIIVGLPSGVHLAAGGSGPPTGAEPGWVGRSDLAAEVAGMRKVYDLVLLDCGSGLGDEVMDFCALADQVMVVTTPETTAVTDAYGMIKALVVADHRGRISLLVNSARDMDEAKATYARVSAVAGDFLGRTVYDAGYVLADPKVPAAVKKRIPFVTAYPRCRASRCMAALASKFGRLEASDVPSKRAGILRRLLGLFR